MMSNYYRVCKSVQDKGILIKADGNLTKQLDKYTYDEAYVSVYKYNEEHKKKFEETGTISGITDVKGDILYFDLDNEDVNIAKKDTTELVNRLKKYFSEEVINVSYSTNKGFHLAIHLNEDITPDQAKTFATNVASDLSSFDSVIYNPARIIRMEGSKHKKTGLYKTRISIDELNSSIKELKELAKEKYVYEKPKKAVLTAKVKSLMSVPKKETKPLEAKYDEIKVDYLSNPLLLSPWKLALSQGIFVEGTRNEALTILAATFKAKGMDKTQAYYGCKAAADLQSKKFGSDKIGKKEIYHAINNVYSPLWNGGSYSEDNFPNKLIQFFEKSGIPRKEHEKVIDALTNLDDVFGDFTHYLENIEKNILKTGIKSLDDAVSFRIGTVNVLAAPPSVGKTSAAIEILNNLANNGHRSFMASYDMYRYSLMTRLAVKHCGVSEKELFEIFKNKEVDKIKNIKDTLSKQYGNVDFCFKTGQTSGELKKTLQLSEKRNGKISFLVVDYLELVSSDKGTNDPTQKSAEAIQGLRDIANSMSICVLVLAQPRKTAAKLDVPMSSFNGIKGSGDINAAASTVITMHREGLSPDTPKEDNYATFTIQKNRFGPLGVVDLGWIGETQSIYELDDKQKMKLKLLRDLKSEVQEDDI